jgi:DNA-binding MarR family transcriptional regulator
MGNISKEDRDTNALKLAAIWLHKENIWLNVGEIKDQTRLPTRTLSRYLNQLVKTNKLERTTETSHPKSRKRLYRPTKEYWQKTFKWIPISPKANDAEYLFFTELASNITKEFEEVKSKTNVIAEKSRNKDAKGLSREKLNSLNALISAFIRAARLDLSREYFTENREPEAVYALLRDSTKRVVDSYLKLWVFINSTYGAREVYTRHMESLQRSAGKLKRRNP